MQKLLHIVLNSYTNDNRVRRAAECAVQTGFAVTLFALSAPDLKGWSENGGVRVNRFSLWTRSWPKTHGFQLVKYVELFLRMLLSGIVLRPHVVHAHDIDALPIGWLVAVLTRSRLIYDAHELWADPAHAAVMPKWMARASKGLEHVLSRRADDCITVSESIANHLRVTYKLKSVHVIRNVPERWPQTGGKQLRKNTGISTHAILILYQGAIGGEGVNTLAKAFRRVSGDAVLVFLGDGPALPALRAELQDLGSRVVFHSFVKPADLPLYTSDADIGVHPMAGGYLNHLWALPNKLFEYIQGGLALVVSDLPEMSKVVGDFQLGMTFPAGDVEALAACLQRIIDNPPALRQFKERSRFAAEQLCWTIEQQKLAAIYKGFHDGRRS